MHLTGLYFNINLFLPLTLIYLNSSALVVFVLLLIATEFLDLSNKRLVWIALLLCDRINCDTANSTAFVLEIEKKGCRLNLHRTGITNSISYI